MVQGWVQYNPREANHYEVQYEDPVHKDIYHCTKWFRIDATGDQTWLEGTDGP